MTRLFLGPLSRTPRGIDRVELALASELFSANDRLVVGVLPTAWGTRIYDAARVRAGLRELEAMWAERRPSDSDPRLIGLSERLNGNLDVRLATGKPMPISTRALRMARLIRATGFSFGRSAKRAVPQGAAYINIGQIVLAAPFFLRWLRKRPDVAPVFMLHDVIPLDTPSYVAPSSVRHHATMIKSTARYAAGLIVTTEHARQTVGEELARHRASALPTLVHGLPVAEVFRRPAEPQPAIATSPYFVICGSIEPRKNHLLLLEVWRNLVAQIGPSAPHLVIVGSAGWRGSGILSQFDQCALTRGYVHPVSGLSSPALTRLLQGAAALLMPSFNEGFGLPVLEARKLGVPVIVSDIPAHREVAGAEAQFLRADDVDGWTAAISDRSAADYVPAVAGEPPQLTTSEDYGRAVAKFLDQCVGMRSHAKHQAHPSPESILSEVRHLGQRDYNPALD